MGVLFVLTCFTIACIAGLLRPFWGLIGYYFFLFLMPEWNWRWSSLPLDFGYQKYIAIATICGVLLTGMRGTPFTGQLKTCVICLCLFLGWAWLSSLQSVNAGLSAVYMDVIWKSVLMAILGARLIDEPKKAIYLFWAILIGSGYNAFRINEDYFITGVTRWVNDNWGLKGDSNIYSLFTFPAIVFAMNFTLIYKNWWLRIGAGLLTVLFLHQQFLMESRGAMLGIAVSTVVALWFAPKSPYFWMLVALGTIATLGLAGPPVVKEFGSIFASKENRDSSAESRVTLWKATLRLSSDYPLFGVGPGATQTMIPKYEPEYAHLENKHPHNFFFEILSGCGAPALACILAIIALPFFRALRILRSAVELDPDRRAVCSILVSAVPGFCVTGMFAGGAMLESFYILIMGCATMIYTTDVDGVESVNWDDAQSNAA